MKCARLAVCEPIHLFMKSTNFRYCCSTVFWRFTQAEIIHGVLCFLMPSCGWLAVQRGSSRQVELPSHRVQQAQHHIEHHGHVQDCHGLLLCHAVRVSQGNYYQIRPCQSICNAARDACDASVLFYTVESIKNYCNQSD